MRLNSDDKTVAAMDLLVPKVGELIGGSQREERLQVLFTLVPALCCDSVHFCSLLLSCSCASHAAMRTSLLQHCSNALGCFRAVCLALCTIDEQAKALLTSCRLWLGFAGLFSVVCTVPGCTVSVHHLCRACEAPEQCCKQYQLHDQQHNSERTCWGSLVLVMMMC